MYKSAINQRKNSEKVSISNELHDCLMSKSSTSFWKTWKNKVSGNVKSKKGAIDGFSDDETVTNLFKDYFQQACNHNSSDFNVNSRLDYERRLPGYESQWYTPDISIFNAEIVALAVANVHNGKAAGRDGLVVEHITHCHPIIYLTLARLFYAMLLCGYVPRDFGSGIMVPIPKDASKAHSTEHFRGITISPVVSKICEHCLLYVYKEYLLTSDNQFGLRKKLVAHKQFLLFAKQ
jgi:hypothetical protein